MIPDVEWETLGKRLARRRDINECVGLITVVISRNRSDDIRSVDVLCLGSLLTGCDFWTTCPPCRRYLPTGEERRVVYPSLGQLRERVGKIDNVPDILVSGECRWTKSSTRDFTRVPNP